MIEFIVFDVGNVIVLADHAITHKILQDYGVPEDRAKLFFENEEYREFGRGRIDGNAFCKALIGKYFKTQLTFEQIVDAHNQHIYAVDEEVVKVLKRLKKSNRHSLAFLTDTNEWQNERVRILIDLREYSDKIFRSNDIHMLKTDNGCFPYVRRELKAEPHEILLVDDSLEKILKAQEGGWQTLQFLNSEQLATDLKRTAYFQYRK